MCVPGAPMRGLRNLRRGGGRRWVMRSSRERGEEVEEEEEGRAEEGLRLGASPLAWRRGRRARLRMEGRGCIVVLG